MEGWKGGARRAHLEHVAYALDTRRVEVYRLVERRRALPSQKKGVGRGVGWEPEGMRSGARGAGRVIGRLGADKWEGLVSGRGVV